MTARGENDSRRNGVPNVTDPSQAEAHVHADAPVARAVVGKKPTAQPGGPVSGLPADGPGTDKKATPFLRRLWTAMRFHPWMYAFILPEIGRASCREREESTEVSQEVMRNKQEGTRT